MKAFLDTSVLVPVFYGDHIHHPSSLDLFTRLSKEDACCGAHSLVEVYSTLTRMPGKYRISSEQAMLFVDNIRDRLSVIALTSQEYIGMLQQFAVLGVAGGAIYDALLAACAMKAKAKGLYTWNSRHYMQFGTEVRQILKTP